MTDEERERLIKHAEELKKRKSEMSDEVKFWIAITVLFVTTFLFLAFAYSGVR